MRNRDFEKAITGKLARQDLEIELRNEVLDAVAVIIFRAPVLNWSELAFGEGYVSKSIETLTGWPHDKINAGTFFDLIHRDDRKKMDGDWKSLPPIWRTRFRLCTSSGSYLRMFAFVHLSRDLIQGAMLPAHPLLHED